MLSDFVGQRGGSLLALGGRSAMAEGGYAGTPVAEVLPVTLNQPRADTGAAPVELALRPTSAGRIHAALRLRDGDAANAARWDSLPPLTSVNHLGTLRPGATTLLTGRASGARDATDLPLLAFQRYGRGMGIVFGVQDSWLWRMHASIPIEDATHATLWRQMMRWMVEGVPDQVEIAAVPARVTPGEPVELRARVVDSTFAPIPQATVVARVTTPTGALVDVPLERSPRGDGTYTGRYVPADRGAYTISAAARAGSDSLHSVDGALLADDQGADVEQAELRTALLRQVSNETGGRYYPLAQSARLADDVNYTESGVTQKDAHDLWDMPIVFLLLVTLLGAEWFYRRRRGLA
jgi:nitrogen fixation protein FixH